MSYITGVTVALYWHEFYHRSTSCDVLTWVLWQEYQLWCTDMSSITAVPVVVYWHEFYHRSTSCGVLTWVLSQEYQLWCTGMSSVIFLTWPVFLFGLCDFKPQRHLIWKICCKLFQNILNWDLTHASPLIFQIFSYRGSSKQKPRGAFQKGLWALKSESS